MWNRGNISCKCSVSTACLYIARNLETNKLTQSSGKREFSSKRNVQKCHPSQNKLQRKKMTPSMIFVDSPLDGFPFVYAIYVSLFSLVVSLSSHSTRFSLATCKSLKTHILQLLSEAFSRHAHPPDSVSRNLLRFLTAVVGYPEVRVIVAQKMEAWIQNPKVGVA